MKIVCSGCGAQHWLSDMQVSHGGCSVSCPNCSTQVFVDASNIDPQSLEPRWYYAVNDDSVGPLSTQDLEFSFQNGQVTLDSFVWCEGMSDWMALGSVPELDYLKSALSGTPAAGEDEATRVAGVGGYAGFSPMGDAMGDAGEETAAIDINELEKQSAGGYSPFDNASGGIVGMDGNAAVDEEPEFNMNSAMPSANDMMGARSENSVLFSLSSLQGMSAVPVETPSGVPSSPNAGLVDVKALAASAPVARRRNNEPVNSFGSAAAMPMATVLPLGNKKDNTPLFIIGGVVGVVLIALIVIIALLVGGNNNNNNVQQDANLDTSKLADNNLGIAADGAEAKKKAEEEAAAKKAEEEAAAAKKAEEEAAAKKAEEEAAAKKAEEEAAAKKAEEEAAAAKKPDSNKKNDKKADSKKPDTKPAETKPDTKTDTKTDTKKTDTKKTDTKKTETKPAGGNDLSRDEVQGVIRASFAAVRTCSRSSAQKGEMKVSFVIKANGRVSNAKVVTPQFANTPTASCVLKVVNGLKFRESSKDTPITYPFQIQ